MRLSVDIVSGPDDAYAVRHIQEEVFRREMGIRLPELEIPPGRTQLELIARLGCEDPVGTLTMVETTGERSLHRRYHVDPGAAGRVARYSRLAVLKPYRGCGVPLVLLLEAYRRFIVPQQFCYSWLLFDAARAASSLMVRLLGFTPGERIIRSEYGACRVLVRSERTAAAEEATRRGWAHIEAWGAGQGGEVPTGVFALAAEGAAEARR